MDKNNKGLSNAIIVLVLTIVIILILLAIFFSQADAFMNIIGTGSP